MRFRPVGVGIWLTALIIVPGCARVSSQGLAPRQASAQQGERCAMCGKAVNEKTKVVVTLPSGAQKVFCCPHCALMEMSMPQAGMPANLQVTVTDWQTGALIPTSAAQFVYGSSLVPCCNPSILPFQDKAAAEACLKQHGGALLSWQECDTRMAGVRCAACGMPTDPDSATHVMINGEEKLACCCMCAAKLLAEHKNDHVHMTAKCDQCGGKIEIDMAGGQIKVEPSGAILWMGTKPRGCHFNHWFDSHACLQAWQAKHPDETGTAMTVDQAVQEELQGNKGSIE